MNHEHSVARTGNRDMLATYPVYCRELEIAHNRYNAGYMVPCKGEEEEQFNGTDKEHKQQMLQDTVLTVDIT